MLKNSAEAKLRRAEHRKATAERQQRIEARPYRHEYGPVGSEFKKTMRGPNSGIVSAVAHVVCGCLSCDARWIQVSTLKKRWANRGYGWTLCTKCAAREQQEIHASAAKSDKFKKTKMPAESRKLMSKVRESAK